MREENAIEVKNLVKSFKVYQDKGHTLKEIALFSKRRAYERREVLRGISFEVRRGEAIGLIGHNGCGKSTTLKLLTRIMYPDSGTIEMRGRVSSLIELGAGFHPDMSGRENIYTNASIFGLTRKEIDERLDDIISFSELQEFIDNPVRTYSSGMYMRLAFSVAINVDADILLIDEILAVGDANFQAKCFEKLHEIKRNGTTIVIVSHSMEQIEQICDCSVWIEGGKIKKKGAPKLVDDEYLYSMEQKRITGIQKQKQIDREKKKKRKQENEIEVVAKEREIFDEAKSQNRKNEEEIEDKWGKLRGRTPDFAEKTSIRMGTGEAEFVDAQIMDVNGEGRDVFQTGEDIYIKMSYKSYIPGQDGNFGIGIFREDGVHCYGTNVDIEYGKKIVMKENGNVEVKIENCNLLPGKYFLDIAVHGEYGYFYDDIRRVSSFYITSEKKDIGVTRLNTKWNAY